MHAARSAGPPAKPGHGVHELVVVSGKGGTGKTSIVGAFAALAGEAVLADCDVDAADLHLLLQPNVLQREEFRAGRRAAIRPADCTQCGLCEEYCRFEAVRAGDSGGGTRYEIDPLACEGCGVCVHFCPEQAIDFTKTVCGEWFVSRTRYGTLVHARLRPAGGLNIARLVPHGSQGDQLFRLKSELFSGVVLDGTWEVAVYLPEQGSIVPPSALAVGYRVREAALAAAEAISTRARNWWAYELSGSIFSILSANLSASLKELRMMQIWPALP